MSFRESWFCCLGWCVLREEPKSNRRSFDSAEVRFAQDDSHLCVAQEDKLRGLASGLLQVLNFGQQERCFVFKLCALDLEIFFRILAGAKLEVQVAQVLIKLILAFQQ